HPRRRNRNRTSATPSTFGGDVPPPRAALDPGAIGGTLTHHAPVSRAATWAEGGRLRRVFSLWVVRQPAPDTDRGRCGGAFWRLLRVELDDHLFGDRRIDLRTDRLVDHGDLEGAG